MTTSRPAVDAANDTNSVPPVDPVPPSAQPKPSAAPPRLPTAAARRAARIGADAAGTTKVPKAGKPARTTKPPTATPVHAQAATPSVADATSANPKPANPTPALAGSLRNDATSSDSALPDSSPRDSSSADSSPSDSPPAGKRRRRWTAPPAWCISALLHGVGLLLLALVTVAALDTTQETVLVASIDGQDEPLEEVELVMEELELEETVLVETTMPVPGAANFGDVTLETRLATTDLGVGVAEVSTVGEIGLLFGQEGEGMSESGPGEGVAYFFGVKTKGNRFVFVVDNSNSMGGGKFETAVAELQRSIGRLNKHQQFYVIFFSDTAYPMFYPKPAKGMVPATDENKRQLEYWLMTVERCLRTKGREALQMAFALRPDAIYVLGDGAFTDDAVAQLMATPPGLTTVHTLGFRMNPNAERDFRDIAKRFQGKFTEVSVTPDMVALSRQLNRPRNRVRHGVWGIQLPPGN
jgi:hypothetical protein